MKARWLVLLLLLIVGRPSLAGPEGEKEVADLAPHATAFLERVAAVGENEAWDRLHADDEDPWIVAEELLLLGREAIARRLGQADLAGSDAALRTYLERAPKSARPLVEATALARTLLEEGAAAQALEVLPAASRRELTVTAARALRVRAEALEALGRPEEATGVLNALTDVVDAIGWRRAAVSAYRTLLGRKQANDQGDETRRILSRLLGLDRDTRDLAQSATWCARLGLLEAGRSHGRLARAWLLEADGLFTVLESSERLTPTLLEQRAKAVTMLAVVQLKLGDIGSGLGTAFRASDLAAVLGSGQRKSAAAVLANAFTKLRRWEEAEQHLREAIAHAEGEAPLRLLELRGNLARLLLNQGKSRKAQAHYDDLRESEVVRKDKRASYVLRLHKAAAWIDNPVEAPQDVDLQRALVDLADMRRDLEREPRTFTSGLWMEANAKAMAGRALNLLNRSAEAIPLLREVIASTDDDAQVKQLLPYALQELASALRRTGKTKEALALTTKLLKSLQEDVDSLTASYAISLLSPPSVGELMQEHLAVTLDLKQSKATIQALEATRGMAFLSESQRRQQRRGRGEVEGGSQEVAALAHDVARSARDYWVAHEGGTRLVVTKARKALWERRQRLRHAEERAGLTRASAPPKPAAFGEGVRFKKRPALERQEAMLYFAETRTEYVAVLIRDERVQTVSLGARATLVPLLEAALETWLDDDAGAHEQALLTILGAALPKRLLSHLGNKASGAEAEIEHIYVSASGPFAHLPWPVLLREALSRDGHPAEALPTVSLVASQRVLQHLRTWNRAATNGPLLAIGDPDYTTEGARRTQMVFFGRSLGRLKASAEEVRALVDEERGDLLLLGADANEALLRRCLFDAPYPFEVLHFSCHGLLYGETPWLSALALHATPGDDGLVTVGDVTQWHFQDGPRMVVLAACDSGLGTPIPGEGEEGLVRAFMLAGARHVVASFWKVPDKSSRDLMIAFHEYRRAGQSPAAGLMRAQLKVKADAKTGEKPPRAWAGWAVWGPRK